MREREREQEVEGILVKLIIEEVGCKIDSGNKVERLNK